MPTMTSVSSRRIDGEVALSLVEQSPDCVKLIDPSGQLRFMSENGLSLMEIEDFDMVEGQMWWDLWPADCQQTLKDAVAAAKQGVQVTFEAPCPTAGGTLKQWRVRVSAVNGGELNDMIVAYSQDISEEHDLQIERKRLETHNLALQHFTRVAAHDLRGPIRHNRLLAEMILETCRDGDEELREYAEEIERSASSMLTLLGDLEAFHMHEDGNPEDMEPIRIDAIIAQALDLVAKGDAQIEIENDVPETRLMMHESQLVSVVKNVVENALKYHEGPESCRVRIESRLDGSDIALNITDNGAGFPRNDFVTIFEPRVRQENSHGKPGSGLGLSIVKQIVEGHGGIVRAKNGNTKTLGGAVIDIRLPALITH